MNILYVHDSRQGTSCFPNSNNVSVVIRLLMAIQGDEIVAVCHPQITEWHFIASGQIN